MASSSTEKERAESPDDLQAAILAARPRSIVDVLPAELFREWDDPNHSYLRSGRYLEAYYGIGAALMPGRILEIGVRYGYSLACLAAGAGAEVVLVEGWDNETYAPGCLAAAKDLIEMATSAKAVLRKTDSQQVDSLDRPYDLIHIDGDHTTAGCLHDLGLTLGRTRYVVVDDYGFPDVRRAVDAFAGEHAAKIARSAVIESPTTQYVFEYVASNPRKAKRANAA